MKTKYLNPVIEALRSNKESQHSLRVRANALRSTRALIGKLHRRLPTQPTACWLDVSTQNYARPIVTLTLYYEGLAGMKDPILEAVLSVFLDSDKQSTKDYAASMNRRFTFDYPHPTCDVQVLVTAYVDGASMTCRKVPTNVKTRVIDESDYVLVCD